MGDAARTLSDADVEAIADAVARRLLAPWEQGSEPGFVYFIGAPAGARIKIGFSVDPASRLTRLQTGSPMRLVLRGVIPGSQALERGLHRAFRAERIAGEWFRMDARLRWLITWSRTNLGVRVAMRLARGEADG